MLVVDSLSMTFGSGPDATTAIRDLSLVVEDQEFVCLVGPSGCGKTTLLKCMSGLLRPSSGTVSIGDRRVTKPPKEMAVVFQDYARSLLPWMSAYENVRLPLKSKGLSKRDQETLVSDAIEAVGLSHAIDRYPWELSGGMQQRVALARALAYRPDIMLMDEPFASVDAQTRSDLEDLVLDMHERYKMTTLFVTHDIDESVYLADRIVVLAPSPTSVVEDLDVQLPRPRDQVATKELREFTRLRSHVYRLIKRRERPREAAEPDSASPEPIADRRASLP